MMDQFHQDIPAAISQGSECNGTSDDHIATMIPPQLQQGLSEDYSREEREPPPPPTAIDSVRYHKALHNLAESMKRTELSRRQLIMQRTKLLGHPQQEQRTLQQMFSAPRERSTPTVFARSAATAITSSCYPPHLPLQHQPHLPSQPSDVEGVDVDRMAAFLSGSRRTLTNNLERSRMQLRMYANHVSKRAYFE